MALEITVAASALRLQARNDANAAYLRDQRDRQAVEDARNKQRDQETRLQAETFSRNRLDQLNRQADQQRVRDRAAQIDLIAENVRLDNIDRSIRDRQDFIARGNAEAQVERNAVQSQITEDIYRREALNAPTPASISFEAYLSERDSRLADRASQTAQSSAATERDFTRSARAVDTLRNDPGQIADNQVRGGVVDFSA